MKQLIALCTLLFTFNAAAACTSIVGVTTPEIPDGVAASKQSMFDAMSTVRSYVQTIEAYLDCRGVTLSDRHYDELVYKASDAAGAYNRELVRFQQRREALTQN